MNIEFCTKSNPRVPDKEVEELYQFLIKHREYLMTTLKIVSQHKDRIKVKDKLERLVKSVVISENKYKNDASETTEFINRVFAFYSSNDMDFRRGDIVELICRDIVLCQECNKNKKWNIIVEAQILKDKVPISLKDIDIIFAHCKVDMLECKAALEKYLHEPLQVKTQEKLAFMDTAKKLISNSDVYFVTASEQTMVARKTLEKYNYTEFKILNSRDIVTNLEALA